MNIIKTLHDYGLKKTFYFGTELINYKINRMCIKRYGERIVEEFLLNSQKINSLDSAFDFASTWKFKRFSIKPLQNKIEFINFANFVFNKIGKPKNIMEIGTANGGTLFLFSKMADNNSTILSIDINHFLENQLNLFQSFGNKSSIKIRNICANTRRLNADTISQFIQKDMIDLLFIDADHSYESVKHDFETFFPFVRVGGIIAFHDINPDRGNGVPKFWEELKKRYFSIEFRAKNYGWGGIGAIIKT